MRAVLPATEERRAAIVGDVPRRQAQHRGDGFGRAEEKTAHRWTGPHHQNLGPFLDLALEPTQYERRRRRRQLDLILPWPAALHVPYIQLYI